MRSAFFIGLPVLLAAMNWIGFWLFQSDKRRAQRGDWRIREGTLIRVALCGGWLGCYLAQARYRHKTRKQPFGQFLFMATLANVVVLGTTVGLLI